MKKLSFRIAALAFVCFCLPHLVGAAPSAGRKLPEPLAIVEVGGAEGVVIPGSHAPFLLSQCSRPTPGPGSSYWIPTAADLERMEKDLPAFIKEHGNPANPNLFQELKKYRRQYAGVVRNGKKAIYVNLFPRRMTGIGWRRQVVSICSRSPSFFGVEYDVSSAKFTHISYNGAK
jgi:hypothetical protein